LLLILYIHAHILNDDRDGTHWEITTFWKKKRAGKKKNQTIIPRNEK
jgi:hypothetical protein